jgi:hypothetical protein
MELTLIMQVLVNLIRQMQYSAHGWLSEMLSAFQLVQVGTGTSMLCCLLLCDFITLRFYSIVGSCHYLEQIKLMLVDING